MIFNKISESDLNTSWSITNNELLKNMKQEDKDNYITLYNAYRSLLTEYLINKLELKKYDDKLYKSDFKFSIVNENYMDVYQYFSSKELKYFYIRNNLFINKLSQKDIDFLTAKVKSNDLVLNNETTKFIEETFSNVIFEDIKGTNKVFMTLYGPDSSKFLAPNNAVILGLRYNIFDTNGLNDNEWKDLYFKQLEFLNSLIKEMKNNFINILNIPINIIQYDDYSILRRK